MNKKIDTEIFVHLRDVLHNFNCYMNGNVLLINGDSFDVLSLMPSNIVHSSINDGFYGIGLPGHEDDNFKPKILREASKNRKPISNNLQSARSATMHAGSYDRSRTGGVKYQQYCYRWGEILLPIMKPGAHMISFCSPQLYHRMATGIEDSGFEIRDLLQWLFGKGTPKSHDISQAIDKIADAERKIITQNPNLVGRKTWDGKPKNITAPATPDAEYWEGWNTALKSTSEPILLARKPIVEQTIAHNVLKWGTGGINIGACRVGDTGGTKAGAVPDENSPLGVRRNDIKLNKGRYPSNTIISDEVALALGDKAKFYYCPKTSKKERHLGCEHLEHGNDHPTPKPLSLMEYLTCLITPVNGICMDIFMGSGTTGVACVKNGFDFIGIEREPEFFEIAKARIEYYQNKTRGGAA